MGRFVRGNRIAVLHRLPVGSESVAASVVGAWVGANLGQCAPVIVELDGPA